MPIISLTNKNSTANYLTGTAMANLMKKRFETLDSLRGICALIVLCYHVHIPLSFTEGTFFRNGKFFVEFFFVLSGFVMLHTYGSGRFTNKRFKDYLISRFFRLWPMHLLMLIIVVGIEIVKLYAYRKGVNFNIVPFSDTTAPKEFIPNLLLLNAWLPNAKTMSFNGVTWSISVEFYIYVLLGFLLMLSAKTRYIIFAAITVLSFYLLYINDVTLFKEEVEKGLSCFFGGCICYLIYERWVVPPSMLRLFTLLEFGLVIAIVGTLCSGWEAKGIIASLIFCLSMVIFAHEKGAISSFLKLSPFTYLGKLSYSIYMVHYVFWLNIIAVAIVLTKFMHVNLTMMDYSGGKTTRLVTTHHVWSDQLAVLLIIACVILISHFTYKYVEKRGIELGKRFQKPKPVPAISK